MNFQIRRRFWKEATTLAEFLQRLKGRTVSLNLGSVQEHIRYIKSGNTPGAKAATALTLDIASVRKLLKNIVVISYNTINTLRAR